MTDRSIVVGTSAGALEVFKVQRAGRPVVDVKSFLAGNALSVGSKLGDFP